MLTTQQCIKDIPSSVREMYVNNYVNVPKHQRLWFDELNLWTELKDSVLNWNIEFGRVVQQQGKIPESFQQFLAQKGGKEIIPSKIPSS